MCQRRSSGPSLLSDSKGGLCPEGKKLVGPKARVCCAHFSIKEPGVNAGKAQQGRVLSTVPGNQSVSPRVFMGGRRKRSEQKNDKEDENRMKRKKSKGEDEDKEEEEEGEEERRKEKREERKGERVAQKEKKERCGSLMKQSINLASSYQGSWECNSVVECSLNMHKTWVPPPALCKTGVVVLAHL